MSRRISWQKLRNDSGRVMRALDRGESFTITRNGIPVGELAPVKTPVFVSAELVAAAFSTAPRIDWTRFRRDLDLAFDQDPRP